ncbi:hypothetical protein [Bacillus mycoides]|uniref:hypothetical protein n=1 Tax=Bacillus mycoides TaxID=1405 RepID=UPI003D1B240C
MEVLSNATINIVLPISIVILTLLIKLIVNHNFTWVGLGKEMVMLPGDVSILAISFITSAILAINNKNSNDLLMNAVVFLVIFFGTTLIVFASSKKAFDIYCLDNKEKKQWAFLCGLIFFSYISSVCIMYVATKFLLTGVKLNV